MPSQLNFSWLDLIRPSWFSLATKMEVTSWGMLSLRECLWVLPAFFRSESSTLDFSYLIFCSIFSDLASIVMEVPVWTAWYGLALEANCTDEHFGTSAFEQVAPSWCLNTDPSLYGNMDPFYNFNSEELSYLSSAVGLWLWLFAITELLPNKLNSLCLH